jgi:hypothetical protein
MAEIDDYFADKPETHKIYRVVEQRILALGPAERAVESQISFGVNRKFAWFWLYNVTQKNPNGILHLMLALDHDTDDPHVRDISKVGKKRWNHQIVIRTVEDAQSAWLGDLLEHAYRHGAR